MSFFIKIINKVGYRISILMPFVLLLLISCGEDEKPQEDFFKELENIGNANRESVTSPVDTTASKIQNTEAEQFGACPEIFPFCSDLSYNFPNNVDKGTAPEGPNYGCNPANELLNPVWYYLEVAQSGKIDIKISQSTLPQGKGAGIDVDYVMWGPFTDILDGCAKIMAGKADPIQSSWSPDPVEYISIGGQGGSTVNAVLYGNCTPEEAKNYSETTLPPAKKGEIYIIIISNWDNVKGYFSFEQTNRGKSGAGATECKIVEECNINGLQARFEEMEGSTYSITGSVSVLNPPQEGDLMIKTSDGKTHKISSAPFKESLYNFTIKGLPASGKKIKIESYFTAVPCNRSIDFQTPEDCGCDVPVFD